MDDFDAVQLVKDVKEIKLVMESIVNQRHRQMIQIQKQNLIEESDADGEDETGMETFTRYGLRNQRNSKIDHFLVV